MLDVRSSGPGSNPVLTHRINMATQTDTRLKLGRPRKFNEEEAVEAAMRVFWDKGYEGASLRDLTEAMGIDRKSMYLTLGDKEALFLKALDEDKKKGVESVLIEGGEDIGMQQGARLKMVLVTETETSRGKIRDEEPIAELQIEEVRAQTSKCKVISGGKKILEGSENKNLRIVFN